MISVEVIVVDGTETMSVTITETAPPAATEVTRADGVVIHFESTARDNLIEKAVNAVRRRQ